LFEQQNQHKQQYQQKLRCTADSEKIFSYTHILKRNKTILIDVFLFVVSFFKNAFNYTHLSISISLLNQLFYAGSPRQFKECLYECCDDATKGIEMSSNEGSEYNAIQDSRLNFNIIIIIRWQTHNWLKVHFSYSWRFFRIKMRGKNWISLKLEIALDVMSDFLGKWIFSQNFWMIFDNLGYDLKETQ